MGGIGVVGLGTMGAGIVEVFAKSGRTVVGVEIDDAAVARGESHLRKSTDRAVSRGKLSAGEQAALHARITLTTDFTALSDADVVVEAIPERMEFKKDLFARLDGICRADAILATNTSSLSVTEIAETTSRPQQVAGMHFFNPAPVMRLVEVIRTKHSSDAVIAAVTDLATAVGKTPVVAADRPGFIANRLLIGYLNQAVKLYESGEATREEIDAAMRAAGLPMGPITLLDVVGLDTVVEILDCIYERDGRSPRHEAAPLLRELVAAGNLGRKTGRGLYDHSEPIPVAEPSAERAAELARELIGPHVGDGQAMVDSGYASEEDIDTAMRLGCGYPNGLFGLLR